MNTKIQGHSILSNINDLLNKQEFEDTTENLTQLWSAHLSALHGQGNWLIIPTTDLPADFSTETYTIVNNALVPASPEIITQRQAIQALANHEATRQARQQRYDSEAITSLYWNWQESGAKADKAKWLAAKEAIRQELPYAGQTELHEKGGEV